MTMIGQASPRSDRDRLGEGQAGRDHDQRGVLEQSFVERTGPQFGARHLLAQCGQLGATLGHLVVKFLNILFWRLILF